uniref:Putative secreted protein n=1 Tax=Ixodes ricinus TaxID=34613 RepID=A0A6B0UKH8_IXORI
MDCFIFWYMTTSLGVPWSLSWSLRLSRCRQSLHTRKEVSGDGPATLLLGVLKAVRFISFLARAKSKNWEHTWHMMPPQSLQWCLLRDRLKGLAHPGHSFTSPSWIQGTMDFS